MGSDGFRKIRVDSAMELYRKYIDPGQLDKLTEAQPNMGVNVLNVGHNIHPANKDYPDTNHPNAYFFNWKEGRVLKEYQLVYIASGSGVFEAKQVGKVSVEPGSVFLLFPDIWHTYNPVREEGWEEFWVGFDGPYAEYLMKQECFNPNSPLIHMGFNTEFMNIFMKLIETLKLEGIAFSQVASCLTVQLLGLVYASALLKEKPQNRKENIINNIRFKFHDHPFEEVSLEELAAQHNVSYVWFRKAFKEVTGISPGQYLLNLRLEKACEMLKAPDKSISEIAFSTGFISEFHFSKIFKKKIKVAPSHFRKQFSK
jgi:AraC-like DNA-binding protein